MLTRARVTVAGAIIAAVADLLLILLVGWHDDKTTYKERGETTGEHSRGRQPAACTAWQLPLWQGPPNTELAALSCLWACLPAQLVTS
jgi:hypothetical protein